MTALDATKFVKARQVFLLRIGVLPQFHPKTGTSHDGDSGTGHTVTFYDVPLMGPNRIGLVGVPMEFDSHVSYAHVGGESTGHSWHVYKSSSETLGDGTPVDVEVGDDDRHFTWTPSESGIFRVELRTSNRKSDKSTDGARFVRVFDGPYDSDLSKSIHISGTFSAESGGYETTVQYKPLDAGETTVVEDWARIVIDVRTFYTDDPPFAFDGDEYNYLTDANVSTGNPVSPTVLFNGIVLENSVKEDYKSETITFKLVSPGYVLQKMPMTGYASTTSMTTEDGSTISVPVEYPLIFGDPSHNIALPDGTSINVVDSIRTSDANFPVHSVSGMHFTDPVYHTLQRHTNFMQWYDVYLEQTGELNPFPYSMTEGDIWAQLKRLQDARLGVLYCSKKGVLYFSRNSLFQDDVWWNGHAPAFEMTFTRDNIEDIQVEHRPFAVAQVQLTGMNDRNIPYFARYPDVPDTIGEIVKRSSLKPFDHKTIRTWAKRMYSYMNKPDTVTITAFGMNRSLDIQDVVGIEYTDRGETITAGGS